MPVEVLRLVIGLTGSNGMIARSFSLHVQTHRTLGIESHGKELAKTEAGHWESARASLSVCSRGLVRGLRVSLHQ